MNQRMLQYFEATYAGQSNEELMHIAVTMDLAAEAKSAMEVELKKRALTDEDLESYRRLLVRGTVDAAFVREKKMPRSKKNADLKKSIVYLASACMCLGGIFLVLIPEVKEEREDGGIFIAMGLAGFIFGLLSAKFSMLLARVLRQ